MVSGPPERASLLISLQKAPVLIEGPPPGPGPKSESRPVLLKGGSPAPRLPHGARAAGLGFPPKAPPVRPNRIGFCDLELDPVCRQPGAWFSYLSKGRLD